MTREPHQTRVHLQTRVHVVMFSLMQNSCPYGGCIALEAEHNFVHATLAHRGKVNKAKKIKKLACRTLYGGSLGSCCSGVQSGRGHHSIPDGPSRLGLHVQQSQCILLDQVTLHYSSTVWRMVLGSIPLRYILLNHM